MARIAVIGAGMGAMAAAARLAVAGHRVTVYERLSTYGGSLGRFERDGFAFDTGPGLLHLPAVWRDLFVKTGKEPLERCVELTQVDPASRHLFADGTEVLLPNASRAGIVSALESALGPGSGERWGEFLGRARETWERSRRPLLEEPLPSDVSPLSKDLYPALRQGLLRRSARTLAEVGTRELRDPRLAALLGSHATAYGLDPGTAPASAAVLPYMEQTFGSWYVKGGLRALADAVYERCLARKVTFVFGAGVTDVLEKDGRAVGLELEHGGPVEADVVVSGAWMPSLFEEHIGLRSLRAEWPHWHPMVGTGRVSVHLALRGGPEAGAVHRTVVHAADPVAEWDAIHAGGSGPHPTVTVLRPDDPLLRPDDDHETVTLVSTVPAEVHGGHTWDRIADATADRMTEAAEAAVPGLRERLLWREVRHPEHTRHATGTGRVPAPALAGADGAFLPLVNAGSLPGLFFAGGWAHPGGGLAHAGMSGALVAGLIVEGADFRGSQ
ncbi:NAD(P)/FAD-dependent oxidoreductase [Streptomyces sp. NPDC006283]|uniref:phytoene desaturase family protein n=1 Tax=Streptomyces sp. NPDC006283 TaxID=3156741 RepID=UPI0033A6D328